MERVRVEYPVKADRFDRPRHDADAAAAAARSATPGPLHALGEAARVVALGVVRVPARDGRLRAAQAPRRSSRRAAARIYATFDLGVIGYWAIPTAPPWFAAQQGLMEDGRTPELRRMMVEYGEQFWKQGWAPSVRCPGRQSPGRHAVAALRHVRDGRARAQRHGQGRRRARLDLRGHAGARARLPRRALRGRPRRRAWRWPRRSAPPRRALTPASRALTQARCRRSRPRRTRMTRAPEQTVNEPPPGDDEDDDDRGLEFNGRTILTLCGFLAAMILALYLLLPQLAGPGGHVGADRGRLAGLDRARVRAHVRHVRRLRGDVPRRLRPRQERIGWRESYLITMAGLAASRIFAAGGAGGLVLQAWALRQAGMRQARGGRQDDQLPRPHLLPLRARRSCICGLGLRLGHLPRRGAVHDDRDPGGDRA